MTDFDAKYVITNNAPGSPAYDERFITTLKEEIVRAAPELDPIIDPVMTALAIGAHRPDIPPRLLAAAIKPVAHIEVEARLCFERFRAVPMIAWSFVGIPWCVPACLGMANVLKENNLLHIASGRTRPPFNDEHIAIGRDLQKQTYANVQNGEVQAMLAEYFADFTLTTWAVVFGYSLAETTNTGVFQKHQVQLLLATAVAASGATRQAKSHMKGAMGLGVTVAGADAVLKAAKKINAWNNVEINDIDAIALDEELRVARLSLMS